MPMRAPRCLGFCGDCTHHLRRSLEQDVVDDRLVLQSDGGDRRGHGEHDVEIRHVKQLRLPVRNPLGACQALALRRRPTMSESGWLANARLETL